MNVNFLVLSKKIVYILIFVKVSAKNCLLLPNHPFFSADPKPFF